MEERREYFDAIEGLMNEAKRFIEIAREKSCGENYLSYVATVSPKATDEIAAALLQVTLDKLPSAEAFLATMHMHRLVRECQEIIAQSKPAAVRGHMINSDKIARRLSNLADAAHGAVQALKRARGAAMISKL